MTAPTILAATAWPTNAHLIEACAQLGYLHRGWLTLDPTYGRGLWWTRWRPERLIGHDLARDRVDFRSLPYDTGTFDAAVFDPPYVSVGGRASTGLPDLHARYGLTHAPTTPAGLQDLIDAGIAEVTRVVRARGFVLVKCQDYISSGRLWPGTHHTLTAALEHDLEIVDRFEHIAPRPRPQPPGRRQVHARRNLSTLFVLRKPR